MVPQAISALDSITTLCDPVPFKLLLTDFDAVAEQGPVLMLPAALPPLEPPVARRPPLAKVLLLPPVTS